MEVAACAVRTSGNVFMYPKFHVVSTSTSNCGLVVECSPATRATRVRFSAVASFGAVAQRRAPGAHVGLSLSRARAVLPLLSAQPRCSDLRNRRRQNDDAIQGAFTAPRRDASVVVPSNDVLTCSTAQPIGCSDGARRSARRQYALRRQCTRRTPRSTCATPASMRPRPVDSPQLLPSCD